LKGRKGKNPAAILPEEERGSPSGRICMWRKRGEEELHQGGEGKGRDLNRKTSILYL